MDSLKHLATVHKAARQHTKALEKFQLLEKVSVENFGHDSPRAIIAMVEHALALGAAEQFEPAQLKIDEARRAIAVDPKNCPMWTRKKALGAAALVCRTSGDFEGARQAHLEKLALCEENPDIWETTASLLEIALCYELEGNINGAKPYYERLGDVCHQGMEEHPDKAPRLALMFAEAYLGCVRLNIVGQLPWNALTMLQQAYETAQQYFPDNKQYGRVNSTEFLFSYRFNTLFLRRSFLGRWHEARSEIYELAGDYVEAKNHALEAIRLLEEDPNVDPVFISALKDQPPRLDLLIAAAKEGTIVTSGKQPVSKRSARRRQKQSETSQTELLVLAGVVAATAMLLTVSAVFFYRVASRNK